MNEQQYLEDLKARWEGLKARLAVAEEGLTPAEMNKHTPAHDWTFLGIVHHLVVVSEAYWAPLEKAIADAKPSTGAPLKHTWFGGKLIKLAGPQGNAPAPKILQPPDRNLDPDLLGHLKAGIETFHSYCDRLQGKDLTGTKFRNPFVKVVPMSLLDAMELHVQHTDRHVTQMEQVAAHLKKGKF
jgi:hypothetical protein